MLAAFRQGFHYQFHVERCHRVAHSAKYRRWLVATDDYELVHEQGCAAMV
jgi:hypothetical protein